MRARDVLHGGLHFHHQSVADAARVISALTETGSQLEVVGRRVRPDHRGILAADHHGPNEDRNSQLAVDVRPPIGPRGQMFTARPYSTTVTAGFEAELYQEPNGQIGFGFTTPIVSTVTEIHDIMVRPPHRMRGPR
jgi:hypothetical protein